jgi:hypothetical protein
VPEDKKIPGVPPRRADEHRKIDVDTVAQVTTALSASYVAWQNRPKDPPPPPPPTIVLPPGVDRE